MNSCNLLGGRDGATSRSKSLTYTVNSFELNLVLTLIVPEAESFMKLTFAPNVMAFPMVEHLHCIVIIL